MGSYMKNKNSFVISLLICLTCISVLISACNVGLGESVDTKPPTVEFTFPEASSVVRCVPENEADEKILVVGGGVPMINLLRRFLCASWMRKPILRITIPAMDILKR